MSTKRKTWQELEQLGLINPSNRLALLEQARAAAKNKKKGGK